MEILEETKIPFVFNGKEVQFMSNVSKAYAQRLWEGLTGEILS